jgi:putative transposase
MEYKAAWAGVPIIQLSKSETRGTSKQCPVCGERLQEDMQRRRQLWCSVCKRWFDRDLVAIMNISYRGWLRFCQSKGEASEAMVKERSGSEVPSIIRVDASKLSPRFVKTEDSTEPIKALDDSHA